MSGFSELIKNFTKTREYVRDFFIYGCKVRNDFDKKSARTYDDEKRRAESWMGDSIRYDDSVRGRQVSISVDSGRIPENPLYSAYYAKSFTDNDIRLHFLLTDILSDGESRTLKDIVNILNEDYGQLFDEQTVRNKLKEYVDEGIIITEKQGRTSYFRLSPDRIDDYFDSFAGLDDAVKFFSETGVLGVVGNSMLKWTDRRNDIFFMKHNYMIHTLEDILVPEIMEAINEKRFISFRSFTEKSSISDKELAVQNQIVPMQILVSVQTGRRYLAGWLVKLNRFSVFRLDSMKQAARGSICEDYDSLYEEYQRKTARCFGVSMGTKGDEEVTPMRVTFCLDEEKEHFIIDRLEREKRCCTIEKKADGLYELYADVYDPNEMMHWLKSFIGRIVSIEGGIDSVRERFYDDIERMNMMYGGSEDEQHIQ